MKTILLLMLSLSLSAFSQDCSDIEKTTDKFSGKITYSSPYSESITVTKIVKDSVTSAIYLILRIEDSYFTASRKGAYIILQDGTKIEKPDVDIKYSSANGGKNEYVAFVKLNDDDIKKLTVSKITDFKLYIWPASVKEKLGTNTMHYISCLSSGL